jgi:hypothetical protein
MEPPVPPPSPFRFVDPRAEEDEELMEELYRLVPPAGASNERTDDDDDDGTTFPSSKKAVCSMCMLVYTCPYSQTEDFYCNNCAWEWSLSQEIKHMNISLEKQMKVRDKKKREASAEEKASFEAIVTREEPTAMKT